MRRVSPAIVFILIFGTFFSNGILLAQVPGSLFWQTSTGWHVYSVAATGDVDGDGFPDVFAGSGNDSITCFSGGGINKGTKIWAYTTAGDVWSVASLSDVNSDGVIDCLAGAADNKIYCISGKPIAGSKTARWNYLTGGDVWVVARIGDVNGDGINDCLAGSGDNKVYCLNGVNGNVIWTYTTGSDVVTVHAIPDVNGDGKEDCLAGGYDNRVVCISGASVGTGALLWYRDLETTVFSVAPIPDVNGDGVSDCLAGGMDENVFCISGGSSGAAPLLWNYVTQAWVKSVSAISDVNGDGKADCLAGGWDDKVFCIEGDTGLLLWSYNTGATILSVTSIADVNNSGVDDCIAGGEDNKVYCIEGKSGWIGDRGIWSYTAGGTVKSVATISDVSGNGSADVIAGSDDSYVYAIEGGLGGTPSETVTTPSTPTGPSAGTVGQSLSYSTGGSTSNLGHGVEYRFDWGDGNLSGWGSATQSHSYTTVGTYVVKAQARCQTHTGVLSGWSSGKSVTVSGYTLSVTVIGLGTVDKSPNKAQYNQNEQVSLTANPASGYQFDQWSVDLTGSSNPAVLTMSGNKSVTATFVQVSETVSTPSTPTGPSAGTVGQSLSYSTGGSTSNLGHGVEYRFDWGDGSFSSWGSSTQSHSYTTVGTYDVKAQARCQTHTQVVSEWSPALTVNLTSTGIERLDDSRIPSNFELLQNYPNPFNAET
ncbi:MAG: hypothetical protein ABIL68_17330, partial [bacterium]